MDFSEKGCENRHFTFSDVRPNVTKSVESAMHFGKLDRHSRGGSKTSHACFALCNVAGTRVCIRIPLQVI